MDYNSGGSAQTKIQSFFAEGNKILKELIDFDMPAHYKNRNTFNGMNLG